jgi:hypothetical protein
LTKSSSAFVIAMAPPKSGEKQVPVGQSNAKTKARERAKSDQLPLIWRHIHTVC